MLAYFLALAVGLGSFALYMAAFFFPEVHRKYDLVWSGVGLFYALVLWVCAGQIRGGLLLGQLAGVALLGWFAWQTLNLRRQVAPVDQQTPLPSSSQLQAAAVSLLSPKGVGRAAKQMIDWVLALVATVTAKKVPDTFASVPDDDPYVPLKREDFAAAGQPLSTESGSISRSHLGGIEPEAEDLEVVVEEAQAALEAATEKVKTTAGVISTDVAATVDGVSQDVARAASAGARGAKSAIAQLPEKAIALVTALVEVGKGLRKPKVSQPVYVRKEYRQTAEETTIELTAPTEERNKDDADNWLDLTPDPVTNAQETEQAIAAEPPEAIAETAADWFEETTAPTPTQAGHSDGDHALPEQASTPDALHLSAPPPSKERLEATMHDTEAKHLPTTSPAPDSEAETSNG